MPYKVNQVVKLFWCFSIIIFTKCNAKIKRILLMHIYTDLHLIVFPIDLSFPLLFWISIEYRTKLKNYLVLNTDLSEKQHDKYTYHDLNFLSALALCKWRFWIKIFYSKIIHRQTINSFYLVRFANTEFQLKDTSRPIDQIYRKFRKLLLKYSSKKLVTKFNKISWFAY